MRKSRYTIVVSGNNGEHLLFNTASGSFAVLDDRVFGQFEAEGGDLEAELAAAGFLTDLSADEELSLQQAYFDAGRIDRSTLTLSLIPTYACNYRCPYCYELGLRERHGKMDVRTEDAILDFVATLYTDQDFEKLAIQWYGGDPSLALDVVERLSSKLCAFCDEREVAYEAMMLTNANRVDEKAADLIAAARISSVLLTIDGPEEFHNRRRVAADGSNSYERNIRAARYLKAAGVDVKAQMNSDKLTLPLYADLRDELRSDAGIDLMLGKINDYGNCFGSGAFSSPDFDLYTHEEFAHAQFGQFSSEPHTADEFRSMLQATDHFCTGQRDNYFIIDLNGDVYVCDGWVGERDYVRFNIFDDPSAWRLSEISHDATRDEKCSECELLPICQGSCIWERECCAKSEGGIMPCHPLKHTLGDYLRLYRDCFDFDTPVEGMHLLA